MTIDESVTLKKLTAFLCFMRLANLARTAEALNLSVVSVHRALHSLEQGVGCALFKRVGRNLVPLDRAFVLAEHARRSLNECEEGIRKVREMAGVDTPRLRLGTLYSLTLQCIPQIIVGLKLRKPELDINLRMGSTAGLLRELDEQTIDAVIIGLDEEVRDQRLVSIPLFQDEMFFAAPTSSPYALEETIDLADTSSEKFIALNDGFVTWTSFRRAFDQAGYDPDIIMQVDDIFSLINLVNQGIGHSLLPGRVDAFSPGVRLIPLADRYRSHQQISLILPADRERDPNLLALAAECRLYRSNQKRPY